MKTINIRSTNDVLTEYSNNFVNTRQSKLNNYGSLNMNLLNSINNSLYLDLKVAVFSLYYFHFLLSVSWSEG